MTHILLHRPSGEPLFVGKAHVRSFGDKWINISDREDIAVQESIKEIAQSLDLMTYTLEPGPTPATVTAQPGEEWPTAAEIHNRFCGHEGNICQACQLRGATQGDSEK